MAGRVDMITTTTDAQTFIRSGNFRPLAVASRERCRMPEAAELVRVSGANAD